MFFSSDSFLFLFPLPFYADVFVFVHAQRDSHVSHLLAYCIKRDCVRKGVATIFALVYYTT